jgi:hypothetical protein
VKEFFKSFLALFWSVSFVAVVVLCIIHPITVTEWTQTLLTTLVGSMITITVGSVGYYFHSSSGSQEKDDTIKTMATTASTGPAPGTGTVTVTSESGEHPGSVTLSADPKAPKAPVADLSQPDNKPPASPIR